MGSTVLDSYRPHDPNQIVAVSSQKEVSDAFDGYYSDLTGSDKGSGKRQESRNNKVRRVRTWGKRQAEQ
jgi:hypothetical protein